MLVTLPPNSGNEIFLKVRYQPPIFLRTQLSSDERQWSLIELSQSQSARREQLRDGLQQCLLMNLDHKTIGRIQPRHSAMQHVQFSTLDINLHQGTSAVFRIPN